MFTTEVPYTNELPPFRNVGARLLEFSPGFRAQASDFVRDDFSPAAMHLLINLVSSTISAAPTEPAERRDPPRAAR